MIVVDTNIIVKLFFKDNITTLCENIYAMDPHWSMPLLWRSEFSNVLVNYMRMGHINLEEAQRTFHDADADYVEKEYKVPEHDVLKLAFESKCTAYDCEYVALAKDLNQKLITLDKKILKSFPDVAILPRDYVKN